jgi:hypothetical protein
MTSADRTTSLSKPRWDGTRILFEIEVDGERLLCAISRSALQDLSGRRHFAAPDLLKGFVAVRERIEAIATQKFRARPESVTGVLSIWADDVDDPPTAPGVAAQANA